MLLLRVEGFLGIVVWGEILVGVWEGWVYLGVCGSLGVVERDF